jgi:glycosyltransferase involved in cell wall biosynthesis
MPDTTAAPRPRLNWFSPLRPARTDIAHYALRTLPALAHHFDIVVWTERPYWPLEIESYARVRQWDGTSWSVLNAADVTLYHIGNNAQLHGWIWEAARRHPGVVVLHDTRLHEFFAGQLLEGGGSASAYLGAVRRSHGAAAALHAAGLLDGRVTADALAESIPLTELALHNARGAIVHTGLAFREVSTLARCPVLQLDLPYDAGAPHAARAWDGTLRLVVFGYLAANRRLESLLEAIATFPDRQRLRLDILGELSDPAAMSARIDALSLGDIVQVQGFVPEEELDQALDRSHLAVNLRFPTMGEASGSQLRIWSRGLASLVTRTGWYAELPPETVGFVDPASEVADLHEHFRAALADPAALRAMGEAGRRRLETQHHPDRYARELSDGIGPMMRTAVPIVEGVGGAVARVLAASGISETAKAAMARRVADELARWTA